MFLLGIKQFIQRQKLIMVLKNVCFFNLLFGLFNHLLSSMFQQYDESHHKVF
jgi:hypothetical protein